MKIVLPDWATVSNGDIDISVFSRYGEVVSCPTTDHALLAERVRDADIVLCNKARMTREVIENAPGLRYIGLFATGFNNIDLDAANDHGVTVCNAGSYSTEAVAQHTFALMLDAMSSVSSYKDFCAKGGWQNSPTFSPFVFPQHELYGRTLGIIGYGSIGGKVAEIARAFGMKVIVYTRTPGEGSEYVSLDELLERSDIITVHCPLTDKTAGMLDAQALAKCKKGVLLINTSRGPVIDETALRQALESGQVGHASLDVLALEPMSPDCPLIGAPHLTLTPHVAWAPVETRERLIGIVCANIDAYLAGQPKNVVNNP